MIHSHKLEISDMWETKESMPKWLSQLLHKHKPKVAHEAEK
jgi:hypothetical protein